MPTHQSCPEVWTRVVPCCKLRRVKFLLVAISFLAPAAAALFLTTILFLYNESLTDSFRDSEVVCHNGWPTDRRCNPSEQDQANYKSRREEGGNLEVLCRMNDFDATGSVATVGCYPSLHGVYSGRESLNALGTTENLVIEYDRSAVVELIPGDFITSQPELKVPVSLAINSLYSRNLSTSYNYPDSKYTFNFKLRAFFRSNSSAASSLNASLLFIWRQSGLSAWEFSGGGIPGEANHPLTSSFGVQGIIRLNTYFRHYVSALNICIWLLTIATVIVIFLLLGQSWFGPFFALRDSTYELDAIVRWPMLAFCGTLLFALPSMRSLWPMPPSAGSRYDLGGIFAQLCLLSFACVLLAADSAVVFARRILRRD